MKEELQLRIFGYIDPQEPLPGSWKARVYELAASKDLTDEQINLLAQAARSMNKPIEAYINARLLNRIATQLGITTADALEAMKGISQVINSKGTE